MTSCFQTDLKKEETETKKTYVSSSLLQRNKNQDVVL
jgi:hypothetical protein